jgi:hypothetical protein
MPASGSASAQRLSRVSVDGYGRLRWFRPGPFPLSLIFVEGTNQLVMIFFKKELPAIF